MTCHLRWMVKVQGSHGWPWLNQMNHKTHDSEKETVRIRRSGWREIRDSVQERVIKVHCLHA